MRHSADQPYIPRAGTLPAQVVNFFMAAPDERLRTRGPACPPRKEDELVDRIAGMRATHEATKKGWK